MNIEFTPVKTQKQIGMLADMADRVWHEHFISILDAGQIDYMVEMFQSAKAIKGQLEQGYTYFFIMADGEYAGYIGIHEEKEDKKLFLSKLYIMKEHRKKGYASRAFEFLKGLCKEKGLASIYLTVNRFNKDTIEVYKAKGFQMIREQVTDIGNDFVMDDYVMELIVV